MQNLTSAQETLIKFVLSCETLSSGLPQRTDARLCDFEQTGKTGGHMGPPLRSMCILKKR